MFDVLGKIQFEGRPLRDLLIRSDPLRRTPGNTGRANASDRRRRRSSAPAGPSRRARAGARRHGCQPRSRMREDMERADARRLQPHYVESFFLEAFNHLGGTARQREPRRYEITHVPAPVRNRDRMIGTGEPVLPRYERIAFEKSLIAPQGQPLAAFVCPGHPLLDATLDLTLDRHRDLLRRGTVLVDERDPGTTPRVLFYLEHAIQDASVLRTATAARSRSRCCTSSWMSPDKRATSTTRLILTTARSATDEPSVDVVLARPRVHGSHETWSKRHWCTRSPR